MAGTGSNLFGHLAVSRGFITQEQLELCLRVQAQLGHKHHLGALMVHRGFITEDQLKELLAVQTRPAEHPWPQLPQLFSSVVRSRQVVPHSVVEPAQCEPGEVTTGGVPPPPSACELLPPPPPPPPVPWGATTPQDPSKPQENPALQEVHCAPATPQAWSVRPSWQAPLASQQPKQFVAEQTSGF